jgi:hypothetical protein
MGPVALVRCQAPGGKCPAAEGDKMEMIDRADAVRHLCRARLPLLTWEQRESILTGCWWEPDAPDLLAEAGTADAEPAGNRPLVIEHSDDGYPHIVGSEPPADVGNPRYDQLIFEAMTFEYEGVTNQYLADQLAAIDVAGVTVTGDPELLYTCPCCGRRTLDEPGGYDICSVCFWEDSGAIEPEQESGPNRMTLGEAQQNYAAFGACDRESLSFVDSTPGKYVRASVLTADLLAEYERHRRSVEVP